MCYILRQEYGITSLPLRDPHPGVIGCACTAIENKRKLFFFGGYCGHGGCYHNNISQLDPDTLIWSNGASVPVFPAEG